MAVIMLILSIVALVGGVAVSACASNRTKIIAEALPLPGLACSSVLALLLLIGGCIGIFWCFLSPPPFSVEISSPPAHHRNDPSRSVYFGNGCFWHTQYDLTVLEQDVRGVFGGRSDADVTSLVGYAGGRYQSPNGAVCYHGLPHTDYGRLGHAEAVSVMLDAGNNSVARDQAAALAKLYFEHGFNTVSEGRRERQDPQDQGAEYRNVIGLPGGMDNVELWPVISAANVHNMPLIRGSGGNDGDTEDEYVVYVYDSTRFPFFRGEAYHQFHTNDVLGRPVPSSYTGTLKSVQARQGRLDNDTHCVEMAFGEVMLLIVFAFGLFTGLSGLLLYRLLSRAFQTLRECDAHGNSEAANQQAEVRWCDTRAANHS